MYINQGCSGNYSVGYAVDTVDGGQVDGLKIHISVYLLGKGLREVFRQGLCYNHTTASQPLEMVPKQN